MNATNLRALVEFYILKKEDRLSQTDRKGDKCMPVKILSFERDINTLTMGAGTHVIFNIVFHITSCQIPNPIRTVGGIYAPTATYLRLSLQIHVGAH